MHGRLLTGELFWGDAGIYFYPMWEFVRRCLLKGELPFWNPFINGGQPLIGNPQMGVFYPTTPLLYWLPTERWLSLITALHLLWSGVGMAFWLRALGCGELARAWGACVWMGCTAVVARAQFPPFLMTIAWYPWVLWAVERVWQQPGMRSTLWLALIGALCLMAGHPQGAYLIALGALLYIGVRWWADESAARQQKWRALGWLLSAGLLTLGLSALYWLPASAVGTLSNYHQMSLGEAQRFRWYFANLGTLFYPFLWGNPMGLYVAKGNYWESAAFIGTVPLLLVPFALGCGRQFRLGWGLGLIALLMVWLALGTDGRLYTMAFHYLPGMRMFHDPARWLLIACLMLTALSALGYGRVLPSPPTPSPDAAGEGETKPLSPAGGGEGTGEGAFLGRMPKLRGEGTGEGVSPGLWLGLLIAGVGLCLLMAMAPHTRTGAAWQRAFLTPRAAEDYPQPSAEQMLEVARRGWQQGALWLGASLGLLALAWRLPRSRALLLWLGFAPLQLYTVYCSLPVAPAGSWAKAKRVLHAPGERWWYPQTYDGWRRHISYLTYANTSPAQMVGACIPNLPMLLPVSVWGAYEPLAPQRVSRIERRLRITASIATQTGSPSVRAHLERWLRALGIGWRARLENAQVRFERLKPPCAPVQVVSQAVPVSDFEDALRLFRLERGDVCQRVRVEGLNRVMQSSGGRIERIERRNDGLHIRVSCGSESVLVVRETLLPGWRAWIDGRPAPLLYAEGILRAIVVPAGTHEVQMRYRPPYWEAGLMLSLISAFCWLGAWFSLQRRRR